MPLLFESISHGELAFGFFNIETDMLLLDDYFFFASDFCGSVTEIASRHSAIPSPSTQPTLNVHVILRSKVGNLHGAIAGTDLSGFIGEVYRLFPFPKEAAAFKQNPSGYLVRGRVEALAAGFGPARYTPVVVNPDSIAVGDYIFDRQQFHALLLYLWLGGYPRWRGDKPPSYIIQMAAAVEASAHPLFVGVTLSTAEARVHGSV